MDTAQQQKSRATESMGAVADALRQTGQQLSSHDQAGIGRMAERAAEQLDRFSNDIQNKNVNELINDVENFARRDPQLFLGGAVVLGLFASRFFKSSANRRRQEQMSQSGQYGNYNRYAPTGGSRVYTATQPAGYRGQTFGTEYSGSYTEAGNTTYTSSASSEPTFPPSGATPASSTHPTSSTTRQPGSQPDTDFPRRTDK